jgi:hypothetical protein
MPPAFTIYRILCSTPPDLEPERLAFEACNAQFAEKVAMPRGVLFAAASLQPQFLPDRQAAAVADNIRMCEFFLQIFGEREPHPAYLSFVDLALACLANRAMPLRRAAVLFRNPPGADPKMTELREKLSAASRCDIGAFRNSQEFEERVQGILACWYREVSAPENPDRSR